MDQLIKIIDTEGYVDVALANQLRRDNSIIDEWLKNYEGNLLLPFNIRTNTNFYSIK